jgi:presenilin-like A22 family membrane protease
VREIDIDTSHVNSPPQPAENLRSPQVRRSVVVLMIIIAAAFALVAIFANIQRLRRGQIETTVVVPASSTTPQPR